MVMPTTATVQASQRVSTEPVSSEPRVKLWTCDDFCKMSELGLFRGKRAVLLSGEIYEMAGQGNWHSVAVGKGLLALQTAFRHPQFWVRPQLPLELQDGTSEPEPDLAVVAGSPDDYSRHPSTALLVVEVSDSSLAMDRRTKTPYYAAAKIPEYWIVNLQDRHLEVHRDPILEAEIPWQPQGPPLARYATVYQVKADESITPVVAPGILIAVTDLFPARPPGDTF